MENQEKIKTDAPATITVVDDIKKEEIKKSAPVFSYKSKNPALPPNSYRRYLEMQQQQQQ